MHIVICGYPRSGTTLLYNMLRCSVKGYDMPPHEVSALKYTSENCITKRPLDFLWWEQIKEKIPDAQFVVCIRDPRSVLTSKHWHSETEYKVSWDWSIHSVKPNGKIKKMMGLVEMDDEMRLVPRPFYVFYENLVTSPNREQERFDRAFNLKFKECFGDFYKFDIPEALQKPLNGVRPLDESRITAWREHKERIKQQFGECHYLHDIMYRLRYESSFTWLDFL